MSGLKFSWHCMLGNAESPELLSVGALFLQFANHKEVATRYYIEFVKVSTGKNME